MQTFNRLVEALEAEGAGALVSLIKVEGSSPRESGARMVVRPSGAFNGTIGGGELEWRALAAARRRSKRSLRPNGRDRWSPKLSRRRTGACRANQPRRLGSPARRSRRGPTAP